MGGDMRKVAVAALLLAAALAPASAEAPWPCAAVEAEDAGPWDVPLVWWEAGGGDMFAQLQARDGPFSLRAVARFHPVGERDAPRPPATTTPVSVRDYESESSESGDSDEQAPSLVQLCVGLTDTTAYTTETVSGQSNVAWVTLHTDPLHPVAVIEINAACWKRTRSVRECRPRVRSGEPLRRLPLYRFSPLSRAFWAALNYRALPADPAPSRPWLRRYNTAVAGGSRSVAPEWIALARLPLLQKAELTGNQWSARPPPPIALLHAVELRLHDNNLTSLPDDFATFMPELETLVLAKNRLSRIPSSLVTLRNLHLLDVTNPLSPAPPFSLDHIADIPDLHILGLENQKLQGDVLPVLLMPSLRFLNLSGCGIKTLGDGSNVPRPATELQTLDLSNNDLEAIPGPILDKFPKLVRLLVNNNRLRTLGDSYWIAPQLSHLDVSHNRLKRIAKIRPMKTPVKRLNLQDNVLEKFEDDFWESLPELEYLDLSHNLLTSPPQIKYQPKLQHLDLSNNECKLLHGVDYSQMISLQYLNMSNNLLVSVSSDIFQFPKLKLVDMSKNRLWFVRITSPSIEYVDLSNNLLTSFPAVNAPHLYSLYLANNLITNVNLSVGAYPNLRELDLSRNGILDADLGNFTLEKVDLSHNKLKGEPLGASGVAELKMEFNPKAEEKQEETTEATSNDWWNTWYIYVIAGGAVLGCITILLLVITAVVVRKLLRKDEPLVLPTSFRTPSPVCLSEPSHVRFK